MPSKKYNAALKEDLKIQKAMTAWPLPIDDGKNIKFQPIPKGVPLPAPLVHEATHIDQETGEVTECRINDQLIAFFNAIARQFRRRHWAAQIELHPELQVDSAQPLTPSLSLSDEQYEEILGQPFDHMIHRSKAVYIANERSVLCHIFTNGVFELTDLRFGLEAKPEFFPYYDQVIRNIATSSGIIIEHLKDGFYGFHQKHTIRRESA